MSADFEQFVKERIYLKNVTSALLISIETPGDPSKDTEVT